MLTVKIGSSNFLRPAMHGGADLFARFDAAVRRGQDQYVIEGEGFGARGFHAGILRHDGNASCSQRWIESAGSKKIPRENGWVFIRQEGSHETWEHPEHGRRQFAAHNDGTEFGKALMSKITKNFKL